MIVLMIAAACVSVYGIHTWDQNQEADRQQSYLFQKDANCLSIGKDRKNKDSSYDYPGLAYYRFSYSSSDDVCAYEEYLIGPSHDIHSYTLYDLFKDVRLSNYIYWTDHSKPGSGDCEEYSSLREQYFGEKISYCPDPR